MDIIDNDIWQEGSDDRECGDCGHTSHSCTCYEKECYQCAKIIDTTGALTEVWDGEYYCDTFCLNAYLNDYNDIKSLEREESDL